MSEYADLKQCAVYVLNSFPIHESGAEIVNKTAVAYFLRHNIPAAQCVVGIRHCVAMGWVQLLPEKRMRLLNEGAAFLKSRSAARGEGDVARRQIR